MNQLTNQFQQNTNEENSLSVKNLKQNNNNSLLFRNLLVSNRYKQFDGKVLKGDLCYDAYYKDFETNGELKYTIYCYCYDLNDITENSELFEFSFEAQIESERGIIGLEAIQWNFTNKKDAEDNLEYFTNKLEFFWKELGSKLFNPQ